MVRVLLVALAWCAVRSEEYGGGAMPQYGGAPDYERAAPSDEYRGHSPDAPALLDYKYEEERQGETEKPRKYIDDVEHWRKPTRIQRRPGRGNVKEEIEPHSLETDTDMGFIPSRRRTRHKAGRRERTRRWKEEPLTLRRASRFSRAKQDDESANYIDNIDYHEVNDNSFEQDHSTFSRETTVRIIRRKQRDRLFAPPPLRKVDDILREQVLNQNEEVNVNPRDGNKDLDYSSGVESDESNLRVRPLLPEPEITREGTKQRGTLKEMAYQDYTDYSMRTIKAQSDFPLLPRRTTTSRRRPSARTSPEDLVRALWPARRAGSGAGGEGAVSILADLTLTPNAAPETTPVIVASTSSTTTQSVSTISSTAAAAVAASKNATDLSIAEKSRLSILRKAKLKERVKDPGTKKPPVLLRVTSRLPTVVMVEPPTSADPWMRAREVDGDSPETLEKVKRLMRLKLVAGAKNIRELTDNWDDTVCDYIDVSMLENAAPRRLSFTHALSLMSTTSYVILNLHVFAIYA